jgi:hypothetical protein
MSPITNIAMGKIIDIRSFREVFSRDLRHLTEENNVVPLRSFFLLTLLREGLGSPRLKEQTEPLFCPAMWRDSGYLPLS